MRKGEEHDVMPGQVLGIIVSLFFVETAPRFAGGKGTEVSEIDQLEAAHPEGVTAKD